jgi:hypothetical protein
MSWPGENGPTSGGAGGRGRRRRADSPAEDPYQNTQDSGGAGRHGSGEYERPAEYVAQAEQEAVAYDQYSGYADPSYYQGGAYQQPQYQRDQYQQDQYQQDSYQQYPAADPYQAQSYGYGSAGYPEVPAQNLDSSGFYQPAYQAPEAPQQPSYEYDAYGQPQAPSYEQPAAYQAAPYQAATPQVSAFPTRPEPVAAFVPEPEPATRLVATETDAEAAVKTDDTGEPEEDLANWLQYVGKDDRRAERARRRRVQLISLATVLVLLVGGAGAWLLFGAGDSATVSQTTVLLQVKDPDGNAIGNVVLVADKKEVGGGTDPSGRGAALLIPSELSVESAALDSQPFGGAMPNSAPAGKDALTTLLGVDVDGVWSMDSLTFAALLNNLIGVTVTVDPASAAAVVDQNGKPVFQAGKQDMTGDKAAYYALYKPKGEAPDKQLARFGQVVQGLLAKIPHQAATTTAVLNSLAAVPDPALPNDKLGAILTALGAEEQGNRFAEQPLPVRSDGSGVMDLDKASPVVKALLGGASQAKDNGGLSRVAVSDGTGRSDTISSRAMAESKLVGSGYTPLDQGVVAATPNTYVAVASQDSMSVGKQVALSLGLPDSAVRVTPFDTTLTDARVVLGADWTSLGQVPADQPVTPTGSGSATGGGATAPATGDTSATGGPTDGTKGSTGRATHRPTTSSSSSSF